MILDRQGRLLSRISIVDLIGVAFLVCLAPLVPFAARVARPLPPEIQEVVPGQCSPGSAVRITGNNFKHGLAVSFGDLPALSVEYYGSDLVIAYVPAEIPPGFHAVRLTNPRGGATEWSDRLKVAPPGPRPKVPVLLTCAFIDLTPGEAQMLEKAEWVPAALPKGPQIVRVVKRGSMSSFRSDPKPGDDGKEYVIADIAVIGEMAEVSGVKRYYYRNQPLLSEFYLRVTLKNRPFLGVIHREPDPDRPELQGSAG